MKGAIDRLQLIQKVGEQIEALQLRPLTPRSRIEPRSPLIVSRPQDLAPIIEHTLLRPDATRQDIHALCDEAKRFGFLAVCVNPVFVEESRRQLLGTDCLVVSVVGFPFGASLTPTKVHETKLVVEAGANEVDMVIALSALKGKAFHAVYEDISAVVDAAGVIPVKVILETIFLDEAEKIAGCLLAMKAGASFVKTSTGFGYVKTPDGFVAGGATIQDVQLMHEVVGNRLRVKASGGIRSFQTARAMVEAGATRLGCSASAAIITDTSVN